MEYLLAIIFFIVAVLYGAVGLGGGSGYLAAMGLAGVPAEVMRPVALTLNILVAGIGAWRYARAGYFSARLFWPIAVAAIPFAFLGGLVALPEFIYRPIVGAMLVFAAWRLWQGARRGAPRNLSRPVLPLWVALVTGAAIGFVSGLSGVGGGIFLGPVLLLAGWSDVRSAMGVSAAFVLTTSVAGLAGRLAAEPVLPESIWLWLAVVGVGGWLGAGLGSKRLDPALTQRLLALILLVGGLRMILGR